MLPLPFGLDLLEQFRVGPFKIVSKFQPCAQSFGIHLKPPSQFLCGRIVKEGNLLIEILHAARRSIFDTAPCGSVPSG